MCRWQGLPPGESRRRSSSFFLSGVGCAPALHKRAQEGQPEHRGPDTAMVTIHAANSQPFEPRQRFTGRSSRTPPSMLTSSTMTVMPRAALRALTGAARLSHLTAPDRQSCRPRGRPRGNQGRSRTPRPDLCVRRRIGRAASPFVAGQHGNPLQPSRPDPAAPARPPAPDTASQIPHLRPNASANSPQAAGLTQS